MFELDFDLKVMHEGTMLMTLHCVSFPRVMNVVCDYKLFDVTLDIKPVYKLFGFRIYGNNYRTYCNELNVNTVEQEIKDESLSNVEMIELSLDTMSNGMVDLSQFGLYPQFRLSTN